MKNVIFLGAKTVGYHCLHYLVENRKELGINLVGLLSSNSNLLAKEHNLFKLAAKNNIPVIESLEDLLEHAPVDYLISVQYNDILKKEHIAIAKALAVNLHMAPLPEYRGCNQFSYAIIEQKKEFGTTLHVMDESIDGGDILFESRFAIPANCFVEELYEQTVKESVKLFEEKIHFIFEGKYTPVKQSTLVKERGTSLHYRREIEKLKVIDLSWPQEKIERYVRATYFPPFEPPYAIIKGNKVFFTVSKQKKPQLVNH